MGYISAIKVNDEVLVWERTENGREVKVFPAPYNFYIRDNDGDFTSMYGDKLRKLVYTNSHDFHTARGECETRRIETFESDIPAEVKVLSEHYYKKPAPTLNISFLDIEVDYDKNVGFASVNDPYAAITSVAIYHTHTKKYAVFVIPPNLASYQRTKDDYKPGPAPQSFVDEMEKISPFMKEPEIEITFCKDEKELLMQLLAEIHDSDAICGWNSDFFDVPYIGKRLEKLGKRFFRMLSFPEGRSPSWRTVEVYGNQNETLDLSGRISADYMVLFRKYEMAERPSYKLESIADEMLPDLPKLEYEGSLAELYRKDFPYFVRYNIRDTEILHGLEDRLGYVDLANQMMHLSTGVWKHVTGTLKLAELAVVNYCHHEYGGLIVNNINMDSQASSIQGAFVLNPQVGMHERIGSIDINSLYPSVIRAVNISPETLLGQFKGEVKAAEAIEKNTDEELALTFDDRTHVPKEVRGKTAYLKASEWRALLLDNKWAVSGFGTVFEQNKQGIIPKILDDWYATRKKYKGMMKTEKDAGNKIKATYYDKLQYVYKIKLNSFYGALTNGYFRFFDSRMGESTTGTGRRILIHQCAKACEALDGEYVNPDTHSIDEDTQREHWGYSDKWSVVYGDSVSGDSVIETPQNSPVHIKDLFKEVNFKDGTKEYCLIGNKTLALTYDPSSKQNVFAPIKYVVRHKVHKRMFRVWIGNTRYVDVTEDHSLIGYANSKHKNPCSFVEVNPTKIGRNNINSLILNSHLPQVAPNNKFQLSKEMWQLIGLIIGDGHVEKARESGVGLSVGSQDKQEIIQKVIEPLIVQGWFTSITHLKNGHDIRLCGTKGYDFLKEHLYSKGHKHFPTWIFDCYISDIEQVLKGYFSADGFANKNKTVGLCSTNMEFVQTSNRLLKLCKIPSNYWTETTENSFRGKYSGTHTKRLTVYDSVRFGQHVGFIQDRKNANIRNEYTKNTQHRIAQNSFALITPTKIEEIPVEDYVYDIEVGGIHTYYANDILVHNTDSSYFSMPKGSTESVIKLADSIGEFVNDSFQDFMRNTFLCTSGFDHYIACGREIVSDRGIFVQKKRYILHIIDNEGYKCDKMKVMGLDTKKTTLPKEVSIELNRFIERYLKGENWDDIAVDIVEYKDGMRTTNDIMSIGLPKGINKVEFYTKELQKDKKTRLPGHVAAAIFYNFCREHYKDTESMPITTGMKIKVFYLKVPQGRFKSIAIPVDIEQVPQWFLEDFEVDREAHIERLVDKPIQNILNAIGKIAPTRQNLYIESIMEF